jgi:hypothetical protein
MIAIGGIKFDIDEYGRVLEIIRKENPEMAEAIDSIAGWEDKEK